MGRSRWRKRAGPELAQRLIRPQRFTEGELADPHSHPTRCFFAFRRAAGLVTVTRTDCCPPSPGALPFHPLSASAYVCACAGSHALFGTAEARDWHQRQRKQTSAFALLKALLGQRVVCLEVYEVMDQVAMESHAQGSTLVLVKLRRSSEQPEA